jgi:TRAP-type C4-dicarboxylate transport system permease small subunit
MTMAPEAERPKLGALHRLGDLTALVCNFVAALALGAIVVINGANVLCRYLFGFAFPWAEELMIFLMILIVFAGAAAVTWTNTHVRIDLLLELLPQKAKGAATLVVTICGAAVLAILVAVSFKVLSMLYAFDQRSLALEIPLWIPQGFVTGGLFLQVGILVLKAIGTPERTSREGRGAE